MSVLRIGYLSIYAMDLEESEKHYTEVIGLRVTARRPGQVYLQALEAQDHHCIILNRADRAGVEHIGFKVAEPADLDEAEAGAKAWGLRSWRVAEGEVAGQSDGLKIELPSGHIFNLFHHSECVGYASGMRDPDIIQDNLNGVWPVTHLDHTLLSGSDCAGTARFLEEVLDFSLTETVHGPDGNPFAYFLTSSNTAHNVAFAPGAPNSLHHIAFYVNDRADVIRRVDMLKHCEVPTFDFGISRHGVAGVSTTYFHDPSGNRNEFQCGVYEACLIPNTLPPIVWAGEHVPRGVFFYESAVLENFFEVVT